MEDHSALIVQLHKQRETLRYGLESAGAAQRLVHRGKIADIDRQLASLAVPAAAPAGAAVASA